MLDIFSEYATDESLEENGAWHTLRPAVPAANGKPAQPAVRLLLARANNRAYGKLLTKKLDEHSEALKTETPESDRLSEVTLAEVMAETILLGWENVGYRGQPMSYSKENALKLLMHKDFRIKVLNLANERDAYKLKEEAEQGEA